MWLKLVTFVAGVVIATVVTLWVQGEQNQEHGGSSSSGRTYRGKQGGPSSPGRANGEVEVQTIRASNDSLACSICLENAKDIVFMPCNHVCCCQVCALQIRDYCPICREPIRQRARVYLA